MGTAIPAHIRRQETVSFPRVRLALPGWLGKVVTMALAHVPAQASELSDEGCCVSESGTIVSA